VGVSHSKEPDVDLAESIARRGCTLRGVVGSLGRRELRLVLAWAELHQDELAENCRLARAGETLREIESLR
jgi:hypothetical protein